MQKILLILLIFTIVFLNSQNAEAQRKIKYKDVYDMILTGDNEKSYSLLLEYQKQEPEFINTYLQLGLISYNWAKLYDPLTDIELVELFNYNTKLYLGLAKGKLLTDPKDVKKNKDYYMNVDVFKQIDKIEYEDVQKFIDDKLVDIQNHDKNVHEIADNFNSSIEYYKTCTDIYMQINIFNSKLKDMYLYPSEDLLVKIEKIVASYDSAIYFFEQYKNAIKNYPVGTYNQNFEIKKIETYRLDGLTNSNFLNNEIIIWDYKTWAQNLKNLVNNDINELRNDIVSTNKEIDDKENELLNLKNYSDDITGYLLDDKLIFKIEKYDYHSIISSFFNYRSSKVDFLTFSRKTFNNPYDSIYNIENIKKAKSYNQVVLKYLYTDSLLKELNSRILEKNIKKFESFFNDNYNGYSGMINYYNQQSINLKSLLDEYLNNFKISLFNENISYFLDSSTIEYQGGKIPFFKTNPNFSTDIAKKYYTTDIDKDSKGNYYISGYFNGINGSQAFVAKTEAKSKISWIRTSTFSLNTYDYIAYSEPFENGNFCILHSVNQNLIKNSLLKFNDTGTQILKLDLSENLIPRFVKYDEINETIILAYKGLEFNNLEDVSDSLIFEKINLLTQKTEWKTKLKISGDLFGIQKIDTIYYAFCNFTNIKDLDGNILTSKSTELSGKNIAVIKISENGTVLEIKPLFSEKAFYGFEVIKLSNEVLNILALKGIQKDIKTNKDLEVSSLIYILINENSNIIFSNWQD